MEKEMLELIEGFTRKYNQSEDKSFSFVHAIAKETILKGIDTSVYSFSEDIHKQILKRYIKASNYFLNQNNDNARFMREKLHDIYSYYRGLKSVIQILNGKRLYGNKFKIFTIRQSEPEVEKVFVTKMTGEKLELALMFVEALVGKEIDLSKLAFYAGLFFDVYEIQNNELSVFGEEDLINFDFDNIGTGYHTHIEAIRSRHGNHKTLLLQCDLLWQEMSFGDRLPRLVYHFYEDDFELITEAEYDKDGHEVFEQLHQSPDIFLNNSQLLFDVSVLTKVITTQDGSYIGSDCSMNVMTAPYTFGLCLERPTETPSELFYNKEKDGEYTIEEMLRPHYVESLIWKENKGA
ncbi:hypothetical protein [Bacillus sp. NPDC094106]|uniref:hypothetical protein n=1 Tax=Bacillus sp. NPDC094106 TaxID=3363949 RepID=UPI00382A8B4F